MAKKIPNKKKKKKQKKVYSEQDEKEIKARLKALGYI